MQRWFEEGCPRCLVIGEIAQAHDGSLGTAHAYIDAVARAGADAVKFQTHIAAGESTRAEPWRVRFSPQDETRYDYWKRMEFTEPQWRGLKEHADERGIVFLSSPFSEAAVDLLERIGVPAYKVASGEVANLPMLDRMAATGRPLLLSSGLSGWEELDAAVEVARRREVPFAVLQCVSAYPSPPEELGLNVLAEVAGRYGCPAGLSDHSGTTYAGLAAATLGAKLVEVHVTFSRACFGPDVSASLTVEELADLVRGVRFLERALAHPVDKEAQAARLSELRKTFGKSIVAARNLPAGHVLRREDLALKKPGTGLPPDRLATCVGRTTTRPLAADESLSDEDLV